MKLFLLFSDDPNNSDELAISGRTINLNTRGVNTEETYYSLKRWHGAEWQRKLPEMYLPRPEKYNAYNSQPVRWKNIKARFRDANDDTGVADSLVAGSVFSE